jgi:aminoglycoside 3-N-acetyltransferase
VPFARAHLIANLQRLGLKPGEIVMVHASVRAIGPVHGGPDEIHHAVLDAVSPGGTVMMYVGCQEGFDDVGRGHYSPAEERDVLEHQPVFNPHAARASRDFGILAEFFRSTPGTLCSAAVDGRVAARGARAAWLTADHKLDYDVGRGTPFDKFVQAGGRVLLLGASDDEVTLLHYAEHIADIPDRRVVRFQVPLLRNGQRTWVTCEQFDTGGNGVHPNWPNDFFARIVEDFLRTQPNARGKVGNAESSLIDAGALVRHAVPLMERQARQKEPVL